jgi:hypothetical protein
MTLVKLWMFWSLTQFYIHDFNPATKKKPASVVAQSYKDYRGMNVTKLD